MLAPTPQPTSYDAPYWDAAVAGKLMLQKCSKTGKFQHYPRGHSLQTHGDQLQWVESPGLGEVHSFTVIQRSFYENLDAPLILAIIELDEQVRVTSHLVNVGEKEVSIGLRVKATFKPNEGAWPTLVFTPEGT